MIVTGSLNKESRTSESDTSLTLAAISLRKVVNSADTFLDNKFSAVRFFSTIEDYQSIDVFVDNHLQHDTGNMMLVDLVTKKNKRKLYGIRSEIGPVIYLKPTMLEEETRVAEFELKVEGFKNHHLRKFKVFKLKLDYNFKAKRLHHKQKDKPKLEEGKEYKLVDLVETVGFMELMLSSTKIDAGVRLNDSIRPYTPDLGKFLDSDEQYKKL